MVTLLVVLSLIALLLTVAEALGKCPGWVPKVFICVVLLIMTWGH